MTPRGSGSPAAEVASVIASRLPTGPRPATVTPAVQRSVDQVIAPSATPEQRQQAYTSTQRDVDARGGATSDKPVGRLVGDLNPGVADRELPAIAAETLRRQNLPAVATPETVRAVDARISPRATPEQRAQAYGATQRSLVTVPRGVPPERLPQHAEQVLTQQGVPTVTSDAVAEVQRSATTGRPADVARTLEAQTRGLAPDQVDGVIRGSQPTLTEVARRPEARGTDAAQFYEPLARVAETGTHAGVQSLSQVAAAGIDAAPTPAAERQTAQRIGEALSTNVTTGGRGALAVETVGVLERSGKTSSANAVAGAVTSRIAEVRETFTDAADRVNELNGQLGQLTATFGPTMSPEQRQLAIDAFKNQHREEYDAYERAAAGLEGVLPASRELANAANETLRDEAGEVFKQLPAFGQSDRGQQYLRQQVELQVLGQPSFLDGLPEAASKVKDGLDSIGKLQGSLVRALGTVALQHAAEGQALLDSVGPSSTATPEEIETARRLAGDRITQAQRTFESLQRNPSLYGLSGPEADALAPAYQAVIRGEPGAVEALNRQLSQVGGGIGGPNARFTQSLRGLGVVAGTIALAQSPQNLAEGVTALGNALSVGGDGGTLALETFGSAGGALGKLFARASGVGGVITAIGDGITAVDAFRRGEFFEGTIKSFSALGGATLAVSALGAAAGVQVVPVAGQIAGGVLLALGAAGSVAQAWQGIFDQEAGTVAYLGAAGVPEDVAEEIFNLAQHTDENAFYNPFTNPKAFADSLGVPEDQLLRTLSGMTPEQREAAYEGGRVAAWRAANDPFYAPAN